MPIFSLLFGVGILVMAENMEAKGQKPMAIHYRRMLWLFLFGLLHSYFLYYGDILVRYAFCGVMAYPFRKLSAKKLLVIGLMVVMVGTVILYIHRVSTRDLPENALEEINKDWFPGEKIVSEEIDNYLGRWSEQMELRALMAFDIQVYSSLSFGLWKALGMILLGMSLFKWGILAGKKSNGFYWKMTAICAGVGLPLEIGRWVLNVRHEWSYDFVMFYGFLINYWGGIFLSLAYVAGIILICNYGVLPRFTRWFAGIGRLALTHYIMQSVICGLLFYGHGFGLMGKVSRTWQMVTVILIVAFQVMFSMMWFKYYRFGPLEWVWRSLTYRKLQPMKR